MFVSLDKMIEIASLRTLSLGVLLQKLLVERWLFRYGGDASGVEEQVAAGSKTPENLDGAAGVPRGPGCRESEHSGASQSVKINGWKPLRPHLMKLISTRYDFQISHGGFGDVAGCCKPDPFCQATDDEAHKEEMDEKKDPLKPETHLDHVEVWARIQDDSSIFKPYK